MQTELFAGERVWASSAEWLSAHVPSLTIGGILEDCWLPQIDISPWKMFYVLSNSVNVWLRDTPSFYGGDNARINLCTFAYLTEPQSLNSVPEGLLYLWGKTVWVTISWWLRLPDAKNNWLEQPMRLNFAKARSSPVIHFFLGISCVIGQIAKKSWKG